MTLELFFPLSYTLSTVFTSGRWDILDANCCCGALGSMSVFSTSAGGSDGEGKEVELVDDAKDNAGVGCVAVHNDISVELLRLIMKTHMLSATVFVDHCA